MSTRHRRGFTLIELMIVVAVTIILAGAAVAYGGTYLSRRRVESVAFQLVQDLRDVQSTAVFTRNYTRVSFFPGANYYTFEKSAGGGVMRRDLNSTVGFASYIAGSSSDGTSVYLTGVAQSPPAAQVDLYFTPQGSPSTSAGVGTPVEGVEGRISLSSRGGAVIDVLVSTVVGRIRMEWH
ncbi:MAG: pilus assembly FimT family protein [Candidatus Cryosericum sp.]